MTGGGGWVIFLGLKFWPKGDFLGLWKTAEIFLGREKKTEGSFWVAKKGQRDIFGYAKKSSGFLGQTNSEVVIFWGIKYEPLLDPPPPPVIKIGKLGPWGWYHVSSEPLLEGWWHFFPFFYTYTLKEVVMIMHVMQKHRLHMKVRLITMFGRGIFWKDLGSVVHQSNILIKWMIRILPSFFQNNKQWKFSMGCPNSMQALMRNMISIFIDLNERWQNYQFQVYNISGIFGGWPRG